MRAKTSNACLGFGLERVALALIKAHGFAHRHWMPDQVRHDNLVCIVKDLPPLPF